MTIAFLRYLAAGLVALALAARHRRRIVVPRDELASQLVRTALIIAAMTALIARARHGADGQARGGFLIAPVVSACSASWSGGEAPTAPRLAGAASGSPARPCCCAPKPGSSPAASSRCSAACSSATYLAAQRGARTPTDGLSTLAVQSLLGAALLAPFALAGGLPAPTPALAAGALALGTLSATCHGLTVAAYRRAEATGLAPFLYFNLIAAAAVGLLWFGETLAGRGGRPRRHRRRRPRRPAPRPETAFHPPARSDKGRAPGPAPLEEGRSVKPSGDYPMAETPVLEAVARAGVGKGAARSARREGYVPGVIYGGGQEPQPINVRFNVLLKQLKAGRFLSTLINVKVDGTDNTVVCRGVQRDVVKDLPTHVDFLRLTDRTRIALHIPIEYINRDKSPGLKRGGVLTEVRHDLELYVTAGNIPEKVTIDLTGTEINDTIHITTSPSPPAPRR